MRKFFLLAGTAQVLELHFPHITSLKCLFCCAFLRAIILHRLEPNHLSLASPLLPLGGGEKALRSEKNTFEP